MKMRLENSIDPLGKDPTKDKTETSRWEPSQQNFLLSVDRPVDRQRLDFRPLGKAVDRTVDRRPQTESKTLCQSTGINREHCSCFRSTNRSTEVHGCTLVHVSRPPGRPIEQFCSASGRLVEGQKQIFEYLFEVKISFDM